MVEELYEEEKKANGKSNGLDGPRDTSQGMAQATPIEKTSQPVSSEQAKDDAA